MKKSKKLLYFIFLWLILGGLIKQFVFNSPLIEFTSDILVLYLYLRVRGHNKNGDIKRIIGKKIPLVISAFLLIGIVSAFINMQPLVVTLWGVRLYVRYYLLFISAYECLAREDILKYKKAIMKLFWFNLFFILIETFVLHIYGDPLGGTLAGGNSAFVNFAVPCFLIASCDYFDKRLSLKKILFIIVLIFYFALAGESKVIYFIIPALFYGTYVLMRKFNLYHLLLLVFLWLALVPTMQYGIESYYGKEYADKVFDYESIETETSGTGFGGDFNRSTQIEMSEKYFLTSPMHSFLGYGVGSGSTSDLFGSFGNKYKYTVFQYFSCSYLLAESGWTGFLLYVLGHIFLLGRFLHYYFRYKHDSTIKKWSTIGILTTFFTFFLFWYNNSPVADFYWMYFIWALCCSSISFRCKDIAHKNVSSQKYR